MGLFSKYKIKAKDIKQYVANYGGCLATKMITQKGLGVNYMSFLIVANCEQIHYEEVERALLRELKLMIDRNGIKKPKPTMYFRKAVSSK